ncbi:MAG: 50S ribosomal protein L35ae [Candidatus Micrarchaeia archaeon]|jgi:large subunit ribosomal protein L35Ae
MKAVILDYRQGRHTQTPNQAIIEVEGVDSKEKAAKLTGRQVVWKTTSGKSIKGKVTAPHGGKGRVRALFEKGLPGQAVGTSIELK